MASRGVANWRCPDCREPVIRARTEAMSWQLLNPAPDPGGNVHAYQAGGNWIARSVPPRTPAVAPDVLLMPHKATCTPRHPQLPAEAPENVTQITEWKRAQGKHSAAGRNRRGRRPGKPVTGIRWRPR